MGIGESKGSSEQMSVAEDGRSERYAAAPSAAARMVGDETVIVDLETEQYFSLNATGAVIWTLVSSGGTLDNATSELVRRYDVGRDQAADDVAELVEQLTDRGLLVLGDS